jgi:hypothetical protein
MKANLNLGSILGIKIKIHWTFFFLIAWVIFDELKRGGNLESLFFYFVCFPVRYTARIGACPNRQTFWY